MKWRRVGLASLSFRTRRGGLTPKGTRLAQAVSGDLPWRVVIWLWNLGWRYGTDVRRVRIGSSFLMDMSLLKRGKKKTKIHFSTHLTNTYYLHLDLTLFWIFYLLEAEVLMPHVQRGQGCAWSCVADSQHLWYMSIDGRRGAAA